MDNAVRQQTEWDEVVKGLHIRHHSTKSVYMLYYRTNTGAQRRPKIGDCTEITLKEARERARMLLKEAECEDEDAPKAKKEITVAELYTTTYEDYWDTERFRDSGWANEARKCFLKNIEPDLGSKKLSELDRFVVRNWHRQFRNRPYAGNRSLQVLSRMFSYAEEEGLRDNNSNPCKGVKLFPEGSRRRFASKEELVKIMQFLERKKEAEPAKVGFLMAILFSGSRPKALQKAKRSQIRMLDGAGILTFRGKSTATTGREESVVFPPAIIELINRVNAPDGTLFGIPFPRYFWKELREQLGCPDLWGRDFRRTFATTALSAGVSMGMIGQLLNHSDPRSTQIYAKLYDDDRVTASLMIASKIAEFGKKPVDEDELAG